MIITIQNPFDASKNISFTASKKHTRTGWGHVASASDGERTIDVGRLHGNGTVEQYTFQTVLHRLAWKWLATATGWRPSTRRDGEKFAVFYNKMTSDIDSRVKRIFL